MTDMTNLGTAGAGTGLPSQGAPARAALRPSTRALYANGGKRLFDLVTALVALTVVVPVLALLALLVARDGAAPFFAHRRVGRGGRPFRCWKLRTMQPDAESRLQDLLARDPVARAEWEATHKLRDDPRVTPLGRILRRTSLDELPQIWNVLAGEMSLVGPRPVTAEELPRYGRDAAAYRAVRPGITGPWQIGGRNGVSYADRVRLDVAYVRDTRFLRDLWIVLRTAGAVMGRTGR